LDHLPCNQWFFNCIMFLAFIGCNCRYRFYNLLLRKFLRNKVYDGDHESCFWNRYAIALKGESQSHVNIFISCYKFCYGIFDQLIYALDKMPAKVEKLPNWFYDFGFYFGLGFQLLLISILLHSFKGFIIPSLLLFSFILYFYCVCGGARET